MQIAVDSVCWPAVQRVTSERIAQLSRDLETAPIDRVPKLQGEIAGLRWLLKLAEPSEPQPMTRLD